MKELGPFELKKYGQAVSDDVLNGKVWRKKGTRHVELCKKTLTKFFSVDNSRPFWFQVHDRPGADRYAFEIMSRNQIGITLSDGITVSYPILYDEFVHWAQRNVPKRKGYVSLVQEAD